MGKKCKPQPSPGGLFSFKLSANILGFFRHAGFSNIGVFVLLSPKVRDPSSKSSLEGRLVPNAEA